MNYENHEAFVLATKRLKSRIQRAKELGVGDMTDEEIVELSNNLALAKAIEQGVNIDEVRDGQDWYVNSLVEAVTKPVNELMDEEYANAMLEISPEEEVLNMLTSLQQA